MNVDSHLHTNTVDNEKYSRSIVCGVAHSDDVVVVPCDQLPSDPEDFLDLLRSEVASLRTWHRLACEYLRNGDVNSFSHVLHSTQESELQAEAAYRNSHSENIAIRHTIAAYKAHQACTSTDSTERARLREECEQFIQDNSDASHFKDIKVDALALRYFSRAYIVHRILKSLRSDHIEKCCTDELPKQTSVSEHMSRDIMETYRLSPVGEAPLDVTTGSVRHLLAYGLFHFTLDAFNEAIKMFYEAMRRGRHTPVAVRVMVGLCHFYIYRSMRSVFELPQGAASDAPYLVAATSKKKKEAEAHLLQAFESLYRSFSLNPNDADVIVGLAILELHMGGNRRLELTLQKEEGKDNSIEVDDVYGPSQRYMIWLELARRTDPGHPSVLAQLAGLAFYDGDLEQALALANSALASAVTATVKAEARFQLGRIYHFKGESDLAKKNLECCTKVSDHSLADFYLAQIAVTEYEKTKDGSCLKRAEERLKHIGTHVFEGQRLLALVLLKRNCQLNRALEMINAALHNAPHNLPCLYIKAQLLFAKSNQSPVPEMRDFEAALEGFEGLRTALIQTYKKSIKSEEKTCEDTLLADMKMVIESKDHEDIARDLPALTINVGVLAAAAAQHAPNRELAEPFIAKSAKELKLAETVLVHFCTRFKNTTLEKIGRYMSLTTQYNTARVCEVQGLAENARKMYKELSSRHGYVDGLLRAAGQYFDVCNWDLCKAYLRARVDGERDVEMPDRRLAMANVCLREGKVMEARMALERLFESVMWKSDPYLNCLLGNVLVELSRNSKRPDRQDSYFSSALKCFLTVLRPPWWEPGSTPQVHKSKSRGVTDLDEDDKPVNLFALQGCAMVYAYCGKINFMQDALNTMSSYKTLWIEPSMNANLGHLLLNSYFAENRKNNQHQQLKLSRASTLYRAAWRSDPHNADLTNYLGYSYIIAKKHSEAVHLWQQAVNQDPANCLFLHNMASAHLQRAASSLILFNSSQGEGMEDLQSAAQDNIDMTLIIMDIKCAISIFLELESIVAAAEERASMTAAPNTATTEQLATGERWSHRSLQNMNLLSSARLRSTRSYAAELLSKAQSLVIPYMTQIMHTCLESDKLQQQRHEQHQRKEELARRAVEIIVPK
eukprot:GHVL01036364.1.p1 GENE.GHVL01036364.1~~GHVL01036364.1.p1  ORF type:complete len:1125 (+),score=187.73 GHVL01036364.1:96-3470(+)